MTETYNIAIDTGNSTLPSIGDWWPSTTTPAYNYYTYTTYPTTIYLYQINCPRCKKMNWAQLDQIKECVTPKCGAKLRAVEKIEDYTIEINT